MVLAEVLRRQGHQVVCLAVKDHAEPVLREICTAYAEFGLGRLGAALRFCRRQRVASVTMAGKIHKVLLFRRLYWLRHLPDWRCFRTFFPHFVSRSRDRRDDTLLGAIVAAFAEEGIKVIPATDFLPEVLVPQGVLSRRRPSRAEAKDIEFGWTAAKAIGRLDIGQTVVVKGQAVLAVEAIEGTDACIRRAGELCPSGGLVVVKVAKPRQDMRFDVPTIGLGTMESLAAAGGRVLAVEADRTILIDQAEVLEFANRHGIAVVSLREGMCQTAADAA